MSITSPQTAREAQASPSPGEPHRYKPLPDAIRRSRQVQPSFTEAEYASLTTLAARYKETPSQMARRIILAGLKGLKDREERNAPNGLTTPNG
jgi:hypothetical protein